MDIKAILTVASGGVINGRLADFLERDLMNLGMLVTAEGTDEEREEAIEYAAGCIYEKLRVSGLTPDGKEFRTAFITLLKEAAPWQRK